MKKDYKKLFTEFQLYMTAWTQQFVKKHSTLEGSNNVLKLSGTNPDHQGAIERLASMAGLVAFFYEELGENIFEGILKDKAQAKNLLDLYMSFHKEKMRVLKETHDNTKNV